MGEIKVLNLFEDDINKDEIYIPLYGTGYIDMWGDYISNCNTYEIQMGNYSSGLPFNIYGVLHRRISKGRKKSTIGWSLSLYGSFYYSNGRDFIIHKGNFKTLSKCKEFVKNYIAEYRSKSINEILDILKDEILTYKMRNIRYIFKPISETELSYIGCCYNSLGNYFDSYIYGRNNKFKNQDLIYNEGYLEIDSGNYIELSLKNKRFNAEELNLNDFYVSEVKVGYGYYSSGGLKLNDKIEIYLNKFVKDSMHNI